jgi:hypothetical protein
MWAAYAIDRGKLYDKFLEEGSEKRFAVRLTKNRGLIHKGAKKNCALPAAAPSSDRHYKIRGRKGAEDDDLLHARQGLSFGPRRRERLWDDAPDELALFS